MSFITLLLYLIATFLRPQDWIAAVYGYPLIYGLSIAIIIFLAMERGLNKDAGLIKIPQNLLMAGLFITILMSHAVHTYFGGMMDAFNAFIVNFLLFFIILNAVNTERKFKAALWFMVVLIAILTGQGIYQYRNGFGWAGQGIIVDHGGATRITWIGIFNDPNDLAMIFVIAVGIVLAFLFGKTTTTMKKLTALAMITYLFYGIYLTNSRGGTLALMATVFFYFVKRSKHMMLGLVAGSVLVVLIFALGPSRMALMSSDEESAYNRIDLWYEGIEMLKANPIFGIGFNMFTEELPQTAHNSFVLAAAELGFVGLFLFMGLIYLSFKGLFIVEKNDDQLKDYAQGLQAGLVGYCAMAFFLSRLYVIIPYLLFAFSGALFYAARQRNKKLELAFLPRDIRNTAFLSIGILTAVYGIIKIGI